MGTSFLMKKTILHINGIEYDAVKVVQEIVEGKHEWKTRGLEFLIQLMDDSEFPVRFKTSGTTGNPKEISFSKEQIRKSASNSCDFFEIKNSDHLLLCLPAEFVAGRMMIARALSASANLVWKEPSLKPDITNEKIDFAAFTPAQVSTIIKDPDSINAFEKIKTIIIGGGEINNTLENQLIKFSNSIYATYGMTETLTHIAVRKIGENIYRSVYKEARFRVNQDQCLEIDLPFISGNKLVTHDVVELVDEHSFIWRGRLDNVINSGGIKIYAEQLECSIIQSQVLNENTFYITSGKDEIFGEVPVIVLLKDEWKGDMATLLTKINGLLNKHEHVKHVHIFDKFELTPTEKLKRKKF
jgi:O-succinylbenzoic acid--CoA ligase